MGSAPVQERHNENPEQLEAGSRNIRRASVNFGWQEPKKAFLKLCLASSDPRRTDSKAFCREFFRSVAGRTGGAPGVAREVGSRFNRDMA